MTQSTVAAMTQAIAGMLGDNRDFLADSCTSEEASAEIAAGIMVVDGDDVDGCAIPAAQEDLPRGVVMLDQTLHKDLEVGDTGYKPGAVLSVVTNGRIWVHVESTLPVRGDEVHYRAEHTAAEPLGYFKVAAVSGKTVDISAFASWTGRTASGVAELEINITNRALAQLDP